MSLLPHSISINKALVNSVLVLLVTACVIGIDYSLSWRMEHDTPLLHYAAFLMTEFGWVPYRDFFETSFIGSFLFHALIGSVLGFGDPAFRLVDFSIFVTFSVVTWRLMSQYGKAVAIVSISLFGIFYFSQGPQMSLQRDYVGTLPIALALAVAWLENDWIEKYRHLLVGILFGLSASIKPHLLIGLPAILFYLAIRDRTQTTGLIHHLLRSSAISALGITLVLAPMFLWLWSAGGLSSFIEIFTHYIPLHLQLTEFHEILAPGEYLGYLWNSWTRLDGYGLLLLPATLGLYFAWQHTKDGSDTRRKTYLLLSLVVLYSIYPVISGQFWDYHWMPFVYFLSLQTSLAFLPLEDAKPRLTILVLVLFLLSVTFTVSLDRHFGEQFRNVSLDRHFGEQFRGKKPSPPLGGRVDEIALILKLNMKRGDTVQPLDWTGGSIHAMLENRIPIATPFFYNYHFYHHPGHPYIQALRQRFMTAMNDAPPTFIIDIENEDKPIGFNTTDSFPELETLLSTHYRPIYTGYKFKILKYSTPQEGLQ